jgi:hypothetical protein
MGRFAAPRHLLVLATIAGIFSARLALSQVDPGYEPVPAANLSERTLRVPEENFSITAPSVEWEWLRDKPASGAPARNYLCRHMRSGERLLLTVFKPSRESGEKLVAEILEGIRRSREATGAQLVDARDEPSDIPVPGSHRLSTMITSGGAPIYFTAYAVVTDRLYVFQRYSNEARESPVFRSFVQSFALAAPVGPRARSPFTGTASALLVYGSILVVCFGLGSLVNVVARRPVVSGGLVALVLIVVVAALRMVSQLDGQPDPEKIGYSLGEALLPVIVAAWLHGRYTNNKDRAR